MINFQNVAGLIADSRQKAAVLGWLLRIAYDLLVPAVTWSCGNSGRASIICVESRVKHKLPS